MKSLREHHLETRLAALQDNSTEFAKILISIELLANLRSWDYLCDKETVLILTKNIYQA
jgi:hypothetical protein